MLTSKLAKHVGLAALVVGGLVGCGDDSESTSTPDANEAGALIRVVHGSPDAPAVDIYVAGQTMPAIPALAYGQASDYLRVPAGDYAFEIRPAGADASTEAVFTTDAVTFADSESVTLLAAGLIGSTDAADSFRVLPLGETFSAPPDGNAIVRVVHASADAPTVAIDVGNDGTPELESLARFADSGAAGVPLPSGQALQIGIWAGDPLARVTSFTTPELTQGAEVFVIATGLLGKLPRETDGFALLAVGEDGAIGFIKQDPTVFALHASPDAPAVDIYAGESKLVSEAAFGDLAQVQVSPGEYTLDFRAAGAQPDSTPAASAATPALAAGERYLAIATGFLGGEPAFQLLPVGDEFKLDDPDNALVRVVHGSPDAPAVDVSPVGGNGQLTQPALVSNLAFPQATDSAGVSVAPGTVTLGVAATGQVAPVASFELALTAGLRAFAVAAGALSPEQGQEAFRLIVVDTSVWPWAAAEVSPLN